MLLMFLIGIRFVTRSSTGGDTIQHTIQPEFPIKASALRITRFSRRGYNERHLTMLRWKMTAMTTWTAVGCP